MSDVHVRVGRNVGIVETWRPRNNHLSHQLIGDLMWNASFR
jgi:hypothetical protein